MTDLAEALSRMFDWFADTFKKQKEQSKSLRRSKDNFAELLDDLGTRYNISQDDLYDIEAYIILVLVLCLPRYVYAGLRKSLTVRTTNNWP